MALDLGDFTPSAPQRKEGFVFHLAGETFTTLPEAPSGVLNDFIAGIQLDPSGRRQYSAPNLIRFIEGVLREEEALTAEEAEARDIKREPDGDGLVYVPTDDVERFRAIVYGKRNVIPIEALGELVIKLGEVLGDRPTQPSVRSASTR